MKKRLIWALVVFMIISACTSAPAAPLPTLAPTDAPIATNPPDPSPSPIPATPTNAPPTPTLAPTTPSQPVAVGPNNFPANVNPLTGLVVSNPELLNRRPMGVKIELFPRMHRPPWGVSYADIVYDYYQNNGLTRFHAIFYGNDVPMVGPIRSARMLDAHLIRAYKSILAFGGADKRVLNNLFNAEFADRLVIEGSHNCPVMCRFDPNGVNLLVTNIAELSKYITAKGVPNGRQNLDGMTFNFNVPAGGQPGNGVSIRISISAYQKWDYNPSSGRYLRSQDTQEDQGQGEGYAPMLDRLTNQQIGADNVVVLLVPHDYAVKTASTEIMDIRFAGKGTAYAFRDGQVYQVQWNRPKSDNVPYLTYPDGKAFPYKNGTTWYEVVGVNSKISKQDGGLWRFVLGIP